MKRLTRLPGRVARRLLPFGRAARMRARLDGMPAFAVPARSIETLPGPAVFRERLLAAIAAAERRIVIVALYLEDDDGGREVLEALYAAKARRPTLDIAVFVDWHRAQRGLIGKARSEGNAGMYRAWARERGDGVAIYGVPVQNRELFGVLHLKGMVIDDTVLYSGASLNNVYLVRHGRYRLDRYHVLRHAPLADAMVGFVQRYFLGQPAVPRLNVPEVPTTASLLPAIRALRQQLAEARYDVPDEPAGEGEVAVTPLAGFGRTANALNDTLLALLAGARERVVLLTPYFNLPRPVRAAVGQLLRRGCTVEIMVGDKVANDFYIPPEQPFRTIGVLPYLYEANLRRFARRHQKHLASGQLVLHLWKHADNSYHLKGLFIDDDVAVLTGNNLNPRAWALDLENALVLRDPHGLLRDQHETEWAALRAHAGRVQDYHALDTSRHYPAPVRKLLRRLSRVRLDRLVNRLL
ncbi:MAG: phosphatidylserine synthase [Lysobacterales bacterium 14-68-21]|jgi:CDP-diacylglycerol--serine O-phosphatidyltransferase|nr:MAG: phosphatidylserine synthase [Xanthomonadales bacterium 15-68-25]OZB68552.1 MAG: phosphatidylserine synthase [Xanthomonadales bacterium 14-68-21]